MSSRRQAIRLQVEGMERRDVPSCAAFGQTISFLARNPEVAGASSLGQIFSELARERVLTEPGLGDDVAAIKALVCGAE